jgi:hypothetical protein
MRREETTVSDNDGDPIDLEICVDLEELEPDANTTVIKNHAVAQAVRRAQNEYADRQAENAASPGPENHITLRVHSW